MLVDRLLDLDPSEVHPRRHAVAGNGRRAAADAVAELGQLAGFGIGVVYGLLPRFAAGGGASADDALPGGVVQDADERRLHVAAVEGELVPCRHLVGPASVVDCVGQGVVDVVVAEDAQGGVVGGDLRDHAAAADEQPWAAGTSRGVACEVEARPGAVGGADAKGVRHAHVAAAGGAARQPYRRRR